MTFPVASHWICLSGIEVNPLESLLLSIAGQALVATSEQQRNRAFLPRLTLETSANPLRASERSARIPLGSFAFKTKSIPIGCSEGKHTHAHTPTCPTFDSSKTQAQVGPAGVNMCELVSESLPPPFLVPQQGDLFKVRGTEFRPKGSA